MLTGLGQVQVWAGFLLKPGPFLGFFLKTQTRSYSLLGQVKPDPLRSGQARISMGQA